MTRDALDVSRLIEGDLADLRRARRAHFVPALALALVAIGGFLVAGVRPDLLAQPAWQLALQLAVWLLCLVALPAVGLGLWFPSRPVRAALAVSAVLAAIGAALGPGLWDMAHGTGPESQVMRLAPCVQATFAEGAVLLALGVLSGAYLQRRARTSALWLSGGIALTALDSVVWHCPSLDPWHNLQGHLGAAGVLLAIAALAGVLVHRRG